jgi:hypothetical protein
MDDPGRRVAAVNGLIARVGSDLPPLTADGELEGAGRGTYERGLGLPKGALAWDRFERELAELTTPRIVALLERERTAPPAGPDPVGPPALSTETYLAETFADLGLEPGETLWLTGSPDVRSALQAVGASVPLLRNHPTPDQLRGYAVAVMCRGPVGHKVMNPWTEAIARMPRHTGPTLVHAASSNISGIARSVWEQREGLKAYVEQWRTVTSRG